MGAEYQHLAVEFINTLKDTKQQMKEPEFDQLVDNYLGKYSP